MYLKICQIFQKCFKSFTKILNNFKRLNKSSENFKDFTEALTPAFESNQTLDKLQDKLHL